MFFLENIRPFIRKASSAPVTVVNQHVSAEEAANIDPTAGGQELQESTHVGGGSGHGEEGEATVEVSEIDQQAAAAAKEYLEMNPDATQEVLDQIAEGVYNKADLQAVTVGEPGGPILDDEFSDGYGNKHLHLVSSKRPELLYNALAGDTKNLLAFQRGTPACFRPSPPASNYSRFSQMVKRFKFRFQPTLEPATQI